jgi:hypothetical protein
MMQLILDNGLKGALHALMPCELPVRADGSSVAAAVQLTKLERRLRDERLAADVNAAQLEATIRRLEAQIAAEKQRRQSEQLRAIVEGATRRTCSRCQLDECTPIPSSTFVCQASSMLISRI